MRTPLTAKSSTRTTNAERTTRAREAMSEFRWEPAENMEWVDAILFLNRDGARGAGGSLRAGYGGCRGCRVHRAGDTVGSRCKFNDQSTMGTHDFGHEFITFTRFPVIRLADSPPPTVRLPCANAEIPRARPLPAPSNRLRDPRIRFGVSYHGLGRSSTSRTPAESRLAPPHRRHQHWTETPTPATPFSRRRTRTPARQDIFLFSFHNSRLDCSTKNGPGSPPGAATVSGHLSVMCSHPSITRARPPRPRRRLRGPPARRELRGRCSPARGRRRRARRSHSLRRASSPR